jgi:MoaA/NifB/PqqE/SkfB family radical SAM enzyme
MAIGSARFHLSLARALGRDRWRNLRWASALRRSLRAGSLRAPRSPLIQILPTELCNLRCRMCNQWGDRGIYRNDHQPTHLEPSVLLRLVAELEPHGPLLSVHGGEPFAYPAIDVLLHDLQRRSFDVLFTTNGTLLGPHAEALSRMDRATFILSVDGNEAQHDLIRGAGAYRATRDGVRALQAAYGRRGRRPRIAVNVTLSEYTEQGGLDNLVDVARDLGAVLLVLTLRWFVTDEAGLRYERQLRERLGVDSCGAWRGFVGTPQRVDPWAMAAAIAAVRRRAGRLRPPFVRVFPSIGAPTADTLTRYFKTPEDTFGRKLCMMPFYAPRIHANGDVVLCHGLHEPVVGNVKVESLETAFQSDLAQRFRDLCLRGSLPTCARCCGLYLTFRADPFQRLWREAAASTSTLPGSPEPMPSPPTADC